MPFLLQNENEHIKIYQIIGGFKMDKQIKLSEIKGITFIGGQITSRIEADKKKNDHVIGVVKVIPPKAIKSGKIEHDELYEVEYKSEFDEKKLTREGDVVVKLSSPYDAAYITKNDEGLLITSFCIIIRNTGKDTSSEFIAAFCNSGIYMRQVMNMVSGATIPMLTIGKVKEVKVKRFSLEEQEQIAKYYLNLCEKQDVMEKIILLEKEKMDTVIGGN